VDRLDGLAFRVTMGGGEKANLSTSSRNRLIPFRGRRPLGDAGVMGHQTQPPLARPGLNPHGLCQQTFAKTEIDAQRRLSCRGNPILVSPNPA